eukprot:Hpha_TRINITY_DN16812_c0_g2::TRINITY_DN16812_c0_g2_i1::g.149988::m.149988
MPLGSPKGYSVRSETGGVDSPSLELYRRGLGAYVDDAKRGPKAAKHAAAVFESRMANGGKDPAADSMTADALGLRGKKSSSKLLRVSHVPTGAVPSETEWDSGAIGHVYKPRGARGAATNAARELPVHQAVVRVQRVWRGWCGRKTARSERVRRVQAARAKATLLEATRRAELGDQSMRGLFRLYERTLFATLQSRAAEARRVALAKQRRRETALAVELAAGRAGATVLQRLWRGRMGRRLASQKRADLHAAVVHGRRSALASGEAAEAMARCGLREREGRLRVALFEVRARGLFPSTKSLAVRAREDAISGSGRTLGACAEVLQRCWRRYVARREAWRRRWVRLVCSETLKRAEGEEGHLRALLQRAEEGMCQRLRLAEGASRLRSTTLQRLRAVFGSTTSDEVRRRVFVEQEESRARVATRQWLRREELAADATARCAALLPGQLRHATRVNASAGTMQRAWRSCEARRHAGALREDARLAEQKRRAAVLGELHTTELCRRVQGGMEPQMRRRLALQQLAEREQMRFLLTDLLEQAEGRRVERERREAHERHIRTDAAIRIQRVMRRAIAKLRAKAELVQRRAERVAGLHFDEASARLGIQERADRRWQVVQRLLGWAAIAPALCRRLDSIQDLQRKVIESTHRGERVLMDEVGRRGGWWWGEAAEWSELWWQGVRHEQRQMRLRIIADAEFTRTGVAVVASFDEEAVHRREIVVDEARASWCLSLLSAELREMKGRAELQQHEGAARRGAFDGHLNGVLGDVRRQLQDAECEARAKMVETRGEAHGIARDAENCRLRAEAAARCLRQEEEERCRALGVEEERVQQAERQTRRAMVAVEHQQCMVRANETEQKRVISEYMRKAKIAANAAERARRAYEEAERLRREADEAMLKAALDQENKARIVRRTADEAKDAAAKAEAARDRATRNKQRVAGERDERVRRAAEEVNLTYRAALAADNANRRFLAAQAGKSQASEKEPDELRAGSWVEAHGLMNNKDLNGVKGQLVRRRGDEVVVSFIGFKTIKVIHVSNVRPCLRPLNSTED